MGLLMGVPSDTGSKRYWLDCIKSFHNEPPQRHPYTGLTGPNSPQ